KGQGAIIATGAIRDVAGAKVMTISSTYDHRIIQGAESGLFLKRLDALLQGADGFFDGVAASLGVKAGAGSPPPAPSSAPPPSPPPPVAAAASTDDLKHVAAATALVRAIRRLGHRAAQLDPLGAPPPGDPPLEPGPLGLTPEAMARIPAEVLRIYCPGGTLADALPHLLQIYCGTIAYEVEHIASHEERLWLRQAIESG